VKELPVATPVRSGIELIAFCAVVLAFPALIGRAMPEANPFDSTPIEELDVGDPEYVFVGNSMVESRIDVATFEQLSNGKVALLCDGGSSSARWYLYLKNYLIPSGAKPQRVFLYFRDWSLSLPRHRLTGEYREGNERAMQPDDTLVQRFMDEKDGRDHIGAFSKVIDEIYPIQRRGMAVREAMMEKLVKRVSSGKEDREKVFDDLEDTFAVKNLRHDLGADLPVMEEDVEPTFSADPNTSFLPRMIDLAEVNGIPLVFVRVKRRPEANGVTEESPRLRQYIEDLRSYLERRGMPFYDETSDRDIPASWYADGDHIAPDYMADYSEHFYRAMKRFFK
jgi:hypothetical protein